MCEKCNELVGRYFPDLSEEDRGALLMGATAYPFCQPDYLEDQLKELVEMTNGSVDQALGYAEADGRKMMQKICDEHKEKYLAIERAT